MSRIFPTRLARPARGAGERPGAVPRRGRAAAGLLALLGGLLSGLAAAQPAESELASLINAYRGEPQRCEGRRLGPATALAREPVLEQVEAATAGDLQRALKQRGYAVSRVQLLTLSGPRDAESAMQLLQQHYCRLLASPQFSELGVAREGRDWRVVLAQPLLSAELGDWRDAGRRMLELVNAARAEARRCGNRRFEAAPPLQWNERLGQAALAHSRDMAGRSYFSHRAPEGSRVADRAGQQGYPWRRIGENIASGQGSPQKAVAGWLDSPEHCRNLMDPGYDEMGAAYAANPRSEAVIYWTQVLGSRR